MLETKLVLAFLCVVHLPVSLERFFLICSVLEQIQNFPTCASATPSSSSDPSLAPPSLRLCSHGQALSAAAATLRFITSTADGILQNHSPGASETLSAAIASGGEIENEASLTITEVRAATEERSAATVQAFARRVLKRVKLQRAAAVAVQARWRGASVRARLATVVETRTGAQAAEEESSAVPLQALARGMLVRAGLRSEVVTAAVVQGAMRGMQARLHEERSRAAVCSAVMTASSEGRHAGYGDNTEILKFQYFSDCVCPLCSYLGLEIVTLG